jgi:hypothetical protein
VFGSPGQTGALPVSPSQTDSAADRVSGAAPAGGLSAVLSAVLSRDAGCAVSSDSKTLTMQTPSELPVGDRQAIDHDRLQVVSTYSRIRVVRI